MEDKQVKMVILPDGTELDIGGNGEISTSLQCCMLLHNGGEWMLIKNTSLGGPFEILPEDITFENLYRMISYGTSVLLGDMDVLSFAMLKGINSDNGALQWENDDYTWYLRTDSTIFIETRDKSGYDDTELREKIDQLQMAKFPNATIIGTPTINQGQISNFSTTSYLQFPFVVNFQDRPFEINFDITTGTDVTNQQNILDSSFGLAFAIRNSKFVIALSTTGTNWDLGEGVGSRVLTANTTYKIKISWDGNIYNVNVSTNGGESYVTDITKTSNKCPYPKQMYIGVGVNNGVVLNTFKGIINMNYASLIISNKLVWQGMDDVGIATRLAVDLSNIDEAGVNKVKDIVGSVQSDWEQTDNEAADYIKNKPFGEEVESYTDFDIDTSYFDMLQDLIIDEDDTDYLEYSKVYYNTNFEFLSEDIVTNKSNDLIISYISIFINGVETIYNDFEILNRKTVFNYSINEPGYYIGYIIKTDYFLLELSNHSYFRLQQLESINGHPFNITIYIKHGLSFLETDNVKIRLNYNRLKKRITPNDIQLSAANGENYSIIEGNQFFNIASGIYSHAEGYNSMAIGAYSHSEGVNSKALGNYSHVEGYGSRATGAYSHAEGHNSKATGENSHAEGYSSEAIGLNSHAEGRSTHANGNHSHSEGYYTYANGNYSHVQGKCNIIDNDNKYAHIIGNGNSYSDSSNAHTIDWEGNGWFQGELRVGGIGQDDTASKKVLTEDDLVTDEHINSLIESKNYITLADLPKYDGGVE